MDFTSFREAAIQHWAMTSEQADICVKKAVEYFTQGYNCCQAVVAAFAPYYNLDHNTALRVSAGFGGGVGRMRMMCGAVSGMVITAGLQDGQTQGADNAGKAECYKTVQQLVNTFKEENGSIICAELLAMNKCPVVKNTNVPDARTVEYYKARPCAQKVESAARIVADHLCNYGL